MNYGERFKQIRKTRWKGTVLELAKNLGSPYAPTIYNIERAWRVPTLPTIARHAEALGCDPWDLLENVDTEFDRLRALGNLPRSEALRRWSQLLEKYGTSTERGSKRRLGEAKARTNKRSLR